MFSVTSLHQAVGLGKDPLIGHGQIRRLCVRTGAFSIFIIMKRLAFHTLFGEVSAGLHPLPVKSISLPGAFPVIKVMRRASAPYLSMTSKGIDAVS